MTWADECAPHGVRKRLDEMLGHMKERIGGKIGNQNNNAFKLRKLFAMYDTQKTGLVRNMFPDLVFVQVLSSKIG